MNTLEKKCGSGFIWRPHMKHTQTRKENKRSPNILFLGDCLGRLSLVATRSFLWKRSKKKTTQNKLNTQTNQRRCLKPGSQRFLTLPDRISRAVFPSHVGRSNYPHYPSAFWPRSVLQYFFCISLRVVICLHAYRSCW